MIKVLMLCTSLLSSLAIAQTKDIERLFKQKSYSKLIKIYRPKYRELDIKSLILLNVAYKRKGNLEEQVKILEQILKKKPDYFKVQYQLAEINKKIAYKKIVSSFEYEDYEKNLNDMMAYYRDAKKLKPSSILPYRGLMEVFERQQNIQEGLALAKEMVKQFGETPETLLYMCQWLSRYGLISQTRITCKRASELNPKNTKPFVLLARTYQDSGDEEKYTDEVFALLEKFPNDPEIIQRAGLIYYNNKDYFKAEQTLAKNHNINKELATIYYGFSLFQNQKYGLALENLKTKCIKMYDHKKEMLRFYEMGLRRLVDNTDDTLRFKYQRAINSCKRVASQNTEIKIRPGHFERGVRLPANAKDLKGNTVREKRATYEASRRKGNEYKKNSKKILNSSRSRAK